MITTPKAAVEARGKALAHVDNQVGAARVLGRVAAQFRPETGTQWDAFQLGAEKLLERWFGDGTQAIVWTIVDQHRNRGGGDADAVLQPWPEHPHLPGPPEPEPLPIDALPPVLRDMARTSHEATQAPLDSAIGAVLGGVSVAIVGKVCVEIRANTEWIKPAHTYIGIEQPSGTGKSPLINMVQKPIATWE